MVLSLDWLWSNLVQVQALFGWTQTWTLRFGLADWQTQTQNLLNLVQQVQVQVQTWFQQQFKYILKFIYIFVPPKQSKNSTNKIDRNK